MDTAKALRIGAGILCMVPALLSIADVVNALSYMRVDVWFVGSLLDFAAGIFLGVAILINNDKLSGAAAIVLAALQLLTCLSVLSSIVAMLRFGNTYGMFGLAFVLLTNMMLLLAFVALAVLFLGATKPSAKSLRLGLAVVGAVLCALGTLFTLVAATAFSVASGLLALSALIYAIAFVFIGVATSREAGPATADASPVPAPAPQPMRYCSTCGSPLVAGAAFCVHCGSRTN